MNVHLKMIENIQLPDWVTKNYDKIIAAKDYGYTIDYGSVRILDINLN